MKKITTTDVAIVIVLLIGAITIFALKGFQKQDIPAGTEISEVFTEQTKPKSTSKQTKESSGSISKKRKSAERNFLAEAEEASKIADKNKLLEILRAWFDDDRGASWRWLVKYRGRYKIELLARILAEKNPEAAVKWFRKYWNGRHSRAMGFIAVGRECFRQNRVSAVDWVMDSYKKGHQTSLLGGVLMEWAKEDVAEAEQWISQNYEGKEKSFFLSMLAAGLAEKNPAAAAELTLKMPEKHFQQWRRYFYSLGLSKAMNEWGKSNPLEAVSWIENLPVGSRKRLAMRFFVGSWSDKDPNAVAEWLYQLPDAHVWGKELRYLAQMQKLSLEWVLELPEGNQKNMLLIPMSEMWVRKSPKDALEWAEHLAEGSVKDEALCKVLGSLMANDDINLETARELSNKISDDCSAKKSLVGAIALKMSDKKPEEAADLLIREFRGFCRYHFGVLFANWAKKDPEATLKWIELLPKSKPTENLNGHEYWATFTQLSLIYENTATGWADRNPEAAAKWAEQIQDGSYQKTNAIEGVASIWAEKDIDAATEWAERLPEESGRERAITGLVNVWANKDPLAAKKWVEALSVSDELRQNLLRIINILIPPEMD